MKTVITCALLLGSIPHSYAQSDGDQLFDNSVLHEIRFESAGQDFHDQLVDIFNNSPFGETPYISGNVRIDGTLIPNVGVRIKGGISAFSAKRPLKIDFNKYVDGQEYDGVKKLNLHNADTDPSVMREVLAYDMFRKAGVKGPRTAYAKVFFNDAYNGVYILVEQVDKNFLRNYFADDEGTLYKNKTCDLEVEAGPETFDPITEINGIAATLSGDAFRNALENTLSTDAFLRYFLIHHFINAVDGPLDVGCNYYIYHEPLSGLLYWIPWDYNLALHNGANYPVIKSNSAEPVFNKMMTDPVYRERYLTHACNLLQYLFTDNYLHTAIDQHAQRIRDALLTDPYFTQPIDVFDNSVAQMKTLVASRRSSFVNGLAALNFTCPAFGNPVDFQDVVINEFMASADSTGGVADPAGGYADWIELYNNSGADIALEGFYLSHDRDFLKHWAFPAGIQIEAGQYLIVWADRDVDEAGLHTDFKIDRDGGQLFLCHEDNSIVDSVSYGAQSTNVAAARVPNGTGDFVLQPHTINASNSVSATGNPAGAPRPKISVSPQPATDVLTVRVSGIDAATTMPLRLLNASGQVVLEFEWENETTAKANVRRLNPGIYYLVGKTGQTTLMKKVVVAGMVERG